MPDSSLGSEIDSVTAHELDALMKEFPEWAEEFPEIQQQLQVARGRPHLRELRHSPCRTSQSAHDSKPYERVAPLGGFNQSPRYTSPGRRTRDSQRSQVLFRRKKLSQNYQSALCKLFDDMFRQDCKDDLPGQYPQTERQDRLPLIFPRGLLRVSNGKFDGLTTTQAHFKKWKPEPIFTFGELPSFTGSILYPGKTALMETTTGTTFKGIQGKAPDPFHPGEGNLKIEGERHLDTTNRSAFVNYIGARPALKITHNPEVIVQRRGKFNGETQSNRDFPGFMGRQPLPPRPVPPAPETIDITFNNLRSFGTEQREQFPGIDTRLHPMMKSAKKEEEAYRLPTVQFETMTSQKLDYRPIDLTRAGLQPMAETKRTMGKMPHFDPMAQPVNNFFNRHVASMTSRCDNEARVSFARDVSGAAKLLTKKQAKFLLKELRMRKAQIERGSGAPCVVPVNTVRVK